MNVVEYLLDTQFFSLCVKLYYVLWINMAYQKVIKWNEHFDVRCNHLKGFSDFKEEGMQNHF